MAKDIRSDLRTIEWAAGVFEGEGCVYLHHRVVNAQVRMTDPDILHAFRDVLGVGKVYGPYVTKQGGHRSRPDWKKNYVWTVRGDDAIAVVAVLFPLMGERRRHKIAVRSTAMRVFETGATRDDDTSKHDYIGYLSPLVMKRYAEYMTKHREQPDGQLRLSDNWKRGIPLDAYVRSAMRHFMDLWLHHEGYGDCAREDIQEALCAIIFNAQGYLHEILRSRIESDRSQNG